MSFKAPFGGGGGGPESCDMEYIHLLTLFGSTTPYGYFFDHHSALFVTASTSTVEIITLVKRRDDAVLEELCLVP